MELMLASCGRAGAAWNGDGDCSQQHLFLPRTDPPRAAATLRTWPRPTTSSPLHALSSAPSTPPQRKATPCSWTHCSRHRAR